MVKGRDRGGESDGPPIAITQQERQAHEDAEMQLDHSVGLVNVERAENHQHRCDHRRVASDPGKA